MNDLERLHEHISQLVSGWSERIEYAVPFQRHTQACNDSVIVLTIQQARHYECDCPTSVEKRTERRWQLPLVTQLVEAGYTVPATGDSSGGSAASNKPGSKPPGNLLRPDEILCRLRDTVYEHLTLWGNLAPRALDVALRTLGEAAAAQEGEHVQDAAYDLRRIVYQARVFLGYDSETVMFESSVCGECGGALKVTRDVDTRTEVRCAGSPATPPCGKRYRWDTWINLLGAQCG